MGGGEDDGVPIVRGAAEGVSRDLGDIFVTASRFDPGSRTAKHRHRGDQVLVTLSGCIWTRFPDGSCRAVPGDVLVHGSNLLHEHQAGPAGAETVAVSVKVGSATTEGLPSLFEAHGVLATLSALPTARRILRELDRTRAHSDLVLRSLALQLLVAAARAADNGRANGTSGEPPWLATAKATLEGDFRRSIRIGGLAEELGVTSMQLIRAFQRHYGTSPGAYLRQVRLEHALGLLAESTRPLTTVALDSGYSDQSHLCRAVKEETGLTPGEYRRSFQNE